MNINDVVTFILSDDSTRTPEGINAVVRAINERQKLNRALKTAVAKSTLSVGMTATISGISPKYLNGMKGTLKNFNKTRSRVDVVITDNQHDYRKSIGQTVHGIPVQCLTPVVTATPVAVPHSNALVDFMENK